MLSLQTSIGAMSISRDGKRAVLVDASGDVIVWNTEEHRSIVVLPNLPQERWNLAVSSDGTKVVSSNKQREVWISELPTDAGDFQNLRNAAKRFLVGHARSVCLAVFSSDDRFVLTASLYHSARLWDVSSAQCLCVLEHPPAKKIGAIALSAEAQLAATGDWNGMLRMWDLKTSECLWVKHPHDCRVDCLSFSRDGKLLITGAEDFNFFVVDSKSAEPLQLLTSPRDSVSAVALSGDHRFAFTGSWDHALRVWDLRMPSDDEAEIVGDCGQAIYCMCLSEDGNTAITADLDDTARVWDVTPKWKLQVWTLMSTPKWDGEMARELSHFF